MRVTALVLAIVGGVFGLLFGLTAMAVGGASNSLHSGSGNGVVWLGVSGIAAATTGMAAAGFYFAGKHRTLMCWVILIAAFWHLFSISYFGIIGFLLLLLASVFAWFGRKDQPVETATIGVAVQTPPDVGGQNAERLRQIARLHSEGILTSEEYEAKRKEILDTL